MYLRELVKQEQCEVNGRHENRGFRVRGGDLIEIEIDPSRSGAMRPEEMALEAVYEDAAMIVVNKPAGMLVHPTHRDKSGTLLNALTHRLNVGGGRDEPFIRPGLVHRLDRETSGLMVIAKNVKAHRKLAERFHSREVEKEYIALVEGRVEKPSGVITAPIGRIAEERQWKVSPDGRPAETHFDVIERTPDRTLLRLRPVTGRTNQLRIHCAHIGHPIIGDVARGGPANSRLCLHAAKLGFRHPSTNLWMVFESQAPAWW
jgi:23S rRNA pseudouridine1911/1915/1917 synthase